MTAGSRGLALAGFLALALLAGLFWWLSGIDDDETIAPPRDVHPALWEVHNKKGKLEGWLFGTIHALPEGVAWRTPDIAHAIKTSRVLVVEVADPGSGGAIFRRLATTPDQPPLASKLPPELRGDLSRLRSEVDLPESLFANLETWAAAIYIANATSDASRAYGIEAALRKDFRHRHLAVLEGTERQLSLFDTLPEDQQRVMLAATLREAADGERDPARNRRAWMAGDMAAIARETHEGFLADPALRETLLTGRNRAWAKEIESGFPRWGPAFVAVGAAHMAGAEGLPALLAADGYTVTRIE